MSIIIVSINAWLTFNNNYYIYTVPPGQPRTLSVESTDVTSIRVHWEAPFVVVSPISYYMVTTHNLNSTNGMNTMINTTTNKTIFTVTGLLPSTTYKLQVVAISQGGDVIAKSVPSESVVAKTIAVTGEC